MNTYLCFRNGKIVTIVQSIANSYENAINVDYVVSNPQESEKQVIEWKKQNSV